MWGGFLTASFVLFTQPFSNDAQYTIDSFSSEWWVGSYISSGVIWTLFIALFLDAFKRYREIIHLVQMCVGWPVLALMFMYTKRPEAYTYGLILGCIHFGMFTAQCRIRYSFMVIPVWPIICMFAVSFGVPGYWDHHTKVEMLYWVLYLLPLRLLHFLEKQTRTSFAEREIAVKTIADMEHKTIVTQRMIANFFPATPTRDLLQQVDSPHNKAYPDTVVIVTDIVGFTAYTSGSNPTDVISMLTEMFKAFDGTAQRFGVEKISTVGDSYCGAVFTCGVKAHTDCCTDAILFSCSSLGFAGSSLEFRVGVHIGDVVGMFVGCAPPKFDLFGPGIEHARLMEERGSPSRVHISEAVIGYVGAGDGSRTDLGVLCRSWMEDASQDNHSQRSEGDSFRLAEREEVKVGAVASEDVEGGSVPMDAKRIVEALCALAHIEPPSQAHPSDGDEDEKTISKERLQHVTVKSLFSRTVVASKPSTPDAGGRRLADYSFHRLWLRFESPWMERLFQQSLPRRSVTEFCADQFILLTIGIFIIQLNLQCTTQQDVGVASAIAALILFMSSFNQVCGGDHKLHPFLTYFVYNALLGLSFLGLTAECGGLSLREKYIGDIGGTYFCAAVFAPQYCLNVRLRNRFVLTLITCMLMAVFMIIRYYTYHDGVATFDPLPVCGISFVIMSFFPDYSLRSAFRMEMELRRMQREARSRGAAMATSALSIMLPSFVTDKIVTLAKEAKEAAAEELKVLGSQTASNTSATFSTDIADIDFNGVAATWEYNHAVLLFAKFHSDDAAFTPDVINATVQAMEDAMKKLSVMKVKTIGSTVIAVAGIDDPRTRNEQVSAVVKAAITIRTSVLGPMEVPGLMYQMGVHCGPCFGAVIGGNGAVFDLFGDTVNTASRMMSYAPYGCIQLSTEASAMLPPSLQAVVKPRPPVVMKGKGTVGVFAVDEDIDEETLHSLLNSSTAGATALERWRAAFGKRNGSVKLQEELETPHGSSP